MGSHTHWFKNKSGTVKSRPDWAGPVVIDIESEGLHSRPSRVRGIVVTGSTAGRQSPPEPSDGMRVSFSTTAKLPSAYAFNQETGENWHNDGSQIMDKGHIMAIEIGGPDVAENIVPQLSNCQEHGTWRRMEREIKQIADAASKGTVYFFTAILSYSRPLLGQFSVPHRVLTPAHFLVTIHPVSLSSLPKKPTASDIESLDLSSSTPRIMFNGELDFNERDDLESARRAMDDFIESAKQRGSSQAEAEKKFGDLFPDVTPKFTTTKKTKVRSNKSVFNAKYQPPPVNFKKQRSSTSQNTIAIQGKSKGNLLTEKQIRAILREMERRGELQRGRMMDTED